MFVGLIRKLSVLKYNAYFASAVCFLFLLKLKQPKNNNIDVIYDVTFRLIFSYFQNQLFRHNLELNKSLLMCNFIFILWKKNYMKRVHYLVVCTVI